MPSCSALNREQLQLNQNNNKLIPDMSQVKPHSRSNKSYKVFDVRDNNVWVRVLNIQDERDQESLQGHGFLSFLSPTYINFTISVAIFYGILFVAAFGFIMAYRSYSSLRQKFEFLERRNQELQQQNQQLKYERQWSQQPAISSNRSSTQLEHQDEEQDQQQHPTSYQLKQQLRLALGDRAPFDFSSIETEEINQEELTTRRSPINDEESTFSGFKSCLEDSPKSPCEADFHTPEKKAFSDPSVDNLTSSPRNRFLSHDVKLVSPKNIDFINELQLVNCGAESLEYQSSQLQQPKYQTPLRQEKELEYSQRSLYKSQSSQPYSESQLLIESQDLKAFCLNKENLQLNSDNFKTHSINKSPNFVQSESENVNITLQNKGDFQRNLFAQQQPSQEIIPPLLKNDETKKEVQMNLTKLKSLLQNPVNDYEQEQIIHLTGLQNQYFVPQLGRLQQFQYSQRNSANNQELQPRIHFDTYGQNRQIMTERGASQNCRPMQIQKFSSSVVGNQQPINPSFNNQRGYEQKFSSQREYNGRFQNQFKQKTSSLGRQAFQQSQYRQPQLVQPKPTYGRNVSNHQSNVSIGNRVVTPPFQMHTNFAQYQQIRSPQIMAQPLPEFMQRGSFGSKESRPDQFTLNPIYSHPQMQPQCEFSLINQQQIIPNNQEPYLQQQQPLYPQSQHEFDLRSIDSLNFYPSTNQHYNVSQLSQEDFQYPLQFQQSFERSAKSPLTTYVQNPQFYEEMILKNQQSASPKCQQNQFISDRIYVDDQFGTLQSNSSIIDNDINFEIKYNFQQLPMGQYVQTGASFVSERRENEDNQIVQENRQSSLYFENGRYKNSFFEMNFLGKGGFGICFKVQHKLDTNFYAIKKIRMHLAQNQDIKEHKVYREIMALPKLNHKNVVRYFGCWAENIDQEQEQKIQKRVKQIQKIVRNQKLRLKNGQKKVNNNSTALKALKCKNYINSDVGEPIFNVNEFDVERDLDEQFRSKERLKEDDDFESHFSSHLQSDSNQSSEKEEDESSYVDGDESYELDEDSHQGSHFSEDEEKDQSDDQSCFDEQDDKVLEMNALNEQCEMSNNLDIGDDDSQGQVGIFDDDALFEFIKKNQQFESIDMMIQMEYCSGDTLHDMLNKEGREVDRYLNFQYFKQILNAVKHIHKNSLIHRDLKPANIFIEGDLLKVGDFGLARKFNINKSKLDKIEQAISSANLKSPKFKQLQNKGLKQLVRSISQQSLLTSNVGTSTYLSPEQEQNKSYNEKVDIYALGLILCELCSVFSTEHERIQTLNDLKKHNKLPTSILKLYPQESEIILMMVNKNPEHRPSADLLCKHELLGQWAKSVNANAKHRFEKQSRSLQPNKENREAFNELEVPNANLQKDPSLNIITEEQTDKSQYMTTSKFGDSLNNSFKLDSINRITFKNSRSKMPKVSSHQDYNRFLNLEEQNDYGFFGFPPDFSEKTEK